MQSAKVQLKLGFSQGSTLKVWFERDVTKLNDLKDLYRDIIISLLKNLNKISNCLELSLDFSNAIRS